MKKHKCGITPESITELKEKEIFVFGSNLSGIHGAGAARLALDKFGAVIGKGIGWFGNSYTFPTKGYNLETLPLHSIKFHTTRLRNTIVGYPENHFLITKVGCGLAGYKVKDIAPLFDEFIDIHNCSLPIEFIEHITN